MRFGPVFLWSSLGAAVVVVALAVPMPVRKVAARQAPLPIVKAVKAVAVRPNESFEVTGVYVLPLDSVVQVGSGAFGQTLRPLVKSGDKVKKGQVLASVDLGRPSFRRSITVDGRSESAHAEELSDALGDALNRYESALADAKDRLEKAKSGREGRLRDAKSELDQVLRAAGSERAREATASAETARSVWQRAKERSDKDQHAYDEGWISRNQATASKNVADAAEQAFREAENQAQRLSQAPSNEDAAQAKAAFARVKQEADGKVQDAEAALAAVQNAGLGMAGPASVPMTLPSEAALAGRIASRPVVRAPIDGTVQVTDGRLSLVKDVAVWELVASVDSAKASRLAVGQSALFPWGDKGQVTSVGTVDPKTGTIKIRVLCPSRPPAKSPAKAVVTVPGNSDWFVLPSSAVLSGSNGQYVFVIQKGLAVQKPVQTALGPDGTVFVTGGLETGWEVVISGSSALKDGIRVATGPVRS